MSYKVITMVSTHLLSTLGPCTFKYLDRVPKVDGACFKSVCLKIMFIIVVLDGGVPCSGVPLRRTIRIRDPPT